MTAGAKRELKPASTSQGPQSGPSAQASAPKGQAGSEGTTFEPNPPSSQKAAAARLGGTFEEQEQRLMPPLADGGKKKGRLAQAASDVGDALEEKLVETRYKDPDWAELAARPDDPKATSEPRIPFVRPAAAEPKTRQVDDDTTVTSSGVTEVSENHVGNRTADPHKTRKVSGKEVEVTDSRGLEKRTETEYTGQGDMYRQEKVTREDGWDRGKAVYRNATSKGETHEMYDRRAAADQGVETLQRAKAPLEIQVQRLRDEVQRDEATLAKMKRDLAALPDEDPSVREKALMAIWKVEDEREQKQEQAQHFQGQLTRLDNLQQTLRTNPESLEEVAKAAESLDTPVPLDKAFAKLERASESGSEVSLLEGRAKTFDRNSVETKDSEGSYKRATEKSAEVTLDRKKGGRAVTYRDSESERRTTLVRDKEGEVVSEETEGTEKASATSYGANLVDGLHAGHEQTRKVERRDGSTSETTASAGFTTAEGFTGAFAGKQKGAKGMVGETKADLKVDSERVAASSEVSGGKDWDRLQVRAKASPDGSYSVVVKPIPGVGGAPPTYQVVTTIKLGVKIGGSVQGSKDKFDAPPVEGASPKLTGGISGGGVGGASFVHTRTLTKAEVEQFLGDLEAVDKGGEPSGAAPELNALQRAKLILKQEGRHDGLTGAIGDGKAARAMKQGDTFTFEVEGGLEGEVEVGLGAVGVGVSGKKTTKRMLTVTRKEKGLVEVTVAFKDETTGGATLKANEGLASGKVGATTSHGEGESLTFVLDGEAADYDTKYQAITRASTRSALEELRERYAAELTASARSKSRSKGRSGEASVDVVKFSVGSGSESSEEVDLRDAESKGTFTGGTNKNASLVVGPLTVAGHRDSEKGEASVDKEGGVSLVASGQTDEDSLSLDGLAAASVGDLGKLQELLKETSTRLHTFDLTPQDIEVLVGRAKQGHQKWMGHAQYAGTGAFTAWAELRGQLVSPQPDPEWTRVDPDKALQLARGRALARFFEAAGGNGRTVLQSAMRNWDASRDGASRAPERGTYAEFPPSLAKEKTRYDKYLKDVEAHKLELGPLVELDDGMSRASMRTSALADQALSLRKAIEGAPDFDDPRARAEMLTRLTKAEEQRLADYEHFHAYWNQARGVVPSAGSDQAFKDLDARKRIDGLESTLRGLKADEKRVLDACESKRLGGIERTEKLGRLQASYDYWLRTIQDLRAAYGVAGTPPSRWKVSQGPGGSCNPEFEPDIDRFNRVMVEHAQFKRDEEQRAAARLEKFSNY